MRWAKMETICSRFVEWSYRLKGSGMNNAFVKNIYKGKTSQSQFGLEHLINNCFKIITTVQYPF